ncbi:MAG: GAF domain-containing protein [Chloroflexi bacterium]|nr:GAF domain-containing protein [Chloroflexota bacterium]
MAKLRRTMPPSLMRRRQHHLAQALARIAQPGHASPTADMPSPAVARRLNAILAVCAALLVTQDIEMILQIVVREADTLFPGSSGPLLFLADERGEQLWLRATRDGVVPSLSVQPGQSLAGHAYFAPRAMLMGAAQIDELLVSASDEHAAQLARVVAPWPPRSALLAPLRVEGQRLGALVLPGALPESRFTPHDLPFIQSLTDLAAVAISARRQVVRTAALQHDLAQSRSLHEQAQARLDAAQAQLLQSAKLAAVGELAASVAHEINNPLYAARNSLYLVGQELPDDAPQRVFLDIAQSELGRIARIITRMRDFYRPARDELETTDVNDLLDETIELVRTHLRHGQVTVVRALDPLVSPITAHADQVRQVFLNVMLNACDAMPGGGVLTVTTSPAGGRAPAGGVLIAIADDGTGIAPEHLPHLFEPFYTTKPQGTGLGLAISAHIITQHGGGITVESELGIGTTFRIVLPASPPGGRRA